MSAGLVTVPPTVARRGEVTRPRASGVDGVRRRATSAPGVLGRLAMDIVPSWLRTESSPVWTVQRLALAAVVLPFGLQSGAIATAPMTAFVAATVCALLLVL